MMILPQTFGPDWKRLLENADAANVKQGGTFEVGPGRVVIQDSAGLRWKITVSTAGVVSAVRVTL
jgi:hypothetical protein